MILVNAKSNERPDKAMAIAQASLAGGGDADQGRATSPLPPNAVARIGDTTEEDQHQIEALKAQQNLLLTQVRQLEAENQTLREDLGFFEKLIPVAKTDGLAIRALQADMVGGMQLRWQLLVIQAVRNAPEFNGRLELVLVGTRNGKPWTQTQPPQGQALHVKQYRRIDGVVDLAPDTVVKTVTARVMDGTSVRAMQVMPVDQPAESP